MNTMNSALVSVVVPVYKTQIYLDQCIQSIMTQTYVEVSKLCVDCRAGLDISIFVYRALDRLAIIEHLFMIYPCILVGLRRQRGAESLTENPVEHIVP